MEILHDIDLGTKTTFHMGGIAKNYYIPECINEIKQLTENIKDDIYIISGGSNLLIDDNKTFLHVCSMERVDLCMKYLGKGEFYIGASNRIQNVISFVNGYGYGGFEELIGLPALFGGIVYMNAGIGGFKNSKFCISDFIERVKVIRKKRVLFHI